MKTKHEPRKLHLALKPAIRKYRFNQREESLHEPTVTGNVWELLPKYLLRST